jgi:acid phosphatase
VVVVIEENHSFSRVMKSPRTPYIRQLAARGASFKNAHSFGHPSQPNYLALFSGSNQDVRGNSCPNSFTTPNLASELIAAGFTFGGYAESLPEIGSSICRASGGYVRRHNPWSNFTNVPATLNLPFASFPTDYARLPTVSFVVPNVRNDMHSGSMSRADGWLRDWLGGYVEWAQTHNSLLIVTWDEGHGDHIPTIFVGPMVPPGEYDESVDHYRVLRSIEAMYGLPAIGHAVDTTPIVDVWSRGV